MQELWGAILTSYTPGTAGRARPVFEARGVGRVSPYFQDYVTVAAFAALGVVLVLALLGIASIFRPAHPHAAKLLTYECGVDPVGSDWSQSQVRYYIFGLLFVIFDVEAVFIFPWAIILERLGVFGLVEMGIFILILLLGLIYAIRKGVLKWE
jgi:NADH-quinone oxidoreductase subunit A